MREDLGTYPEQPLNWYALLLAFIFGLIANSYLYHALFCLFILYISCLSKEKIFYISTILSFVFGFIYGTVPSFPNEDKTPAWFVPNGENTFIAKVDDVKSLADRRWRAIISDIRPIDEVKENALHGKATLYFYCDKDEDFIPPLKGMQVQFTSKIKPVKFSSNPGIIDGEQYWFDKDIFYTSYLSPQYSKFEYFGEASFFARLRMDIIQAYIAQCKDENGKVSQAHAFLLGILFGEKFYFDTTITNLFTKASLIHTLALSGMHLAFVVLCALCIINAVSYFKPNIFLRMPKTLAIGIFSLPFAIIYLWLGNFPISLMRAALMLIIIWICSAKYKNFSLLDCLCLTAGILLIIFPRAWADISFQLSVLAVLSIAIFSPLFSSFRFYLTRKRADFYIPLYIKIPLYALALAWTSFSIQIFLLPLLAYTFGVVSPHFYLNIIWIPLVELFVLPFAFLGLFTLPFNFLSEFFISCASFIVHYFILFLSYLENASFLKMWQVYRFSLWQGIGFYLLILALYNCRNKYRRNVLSIFAILCLFSQPLYAKYDNYKANIDERMQITALSVGQGQSILLEWASKDGKKRAIIDAGGLYGERFDTGRDIVAKVLSYQNFAHLDYMIVSHFDLDHVKGMFHLAEHFSIDEFIHSRYDKPKDLKTNLLAKVQANNIEERLVAVDDIIILEEDRYWLEVLFPPITGNFSSNNASLVLRLVYKGEGIALFCGDIENSGIRRMLALKPNLQADLLVLPHHGSKSSYYEEFYKAVNPTKVISSNGIYGRYVYPDPRIVEYFNAIDIEVLDTGNLDAITYTYSRSLWE